MFIPQPNEWQAGGVPVVPAGFDGSFQGMQQVGGFNVAMAMNPQAQEFVPGVTPGT